MGLFKNNIIKYGFACGQIKSLENQLLSKNRLERLIESNNLKEQLRILSETDFGSYLNEANDIETIENGLERYLVDFYISVTKMTNNPKIGLFFRIKRDFHNLKIAVKEKLGVSGLNNAYRNAGAITVENLEKAFRNGNYSSLKQFQPCIVKALEKYEEEQDFWAVENELDKHYFDMLKQIASELNNQFMKKLVKIMIDLANLKTCFRFKKWDLESNQLFDTIIPGGSIKKPQIIKLYLRNFTLLVETFSRKGYSSITDKVFEEDKIILENIDVNIDNHIIGFVKKSHYVSVGIEPIVAYIFAKEMEVKSLRMVFSGTYNKLEPIEVVSNIRELYA